MDTKAKNPSRFLDLIPDDLIALITHHQKMILSRRDSVAPG